MITLPVHVIDDDEDVLSSCGFLLSGLNIRAFLWSGAWDFVERIDLSQAAIVLSDVMMPNMDGKALQHYLQERHSPMSFIVMTGRGEIQDAVAMMKLGAVDYLEKPLNLQRLQESLTKAQSLSKQQHYRQQCLQRYQTLTEKEKHIAALMMQGKLNKVMAEELGIAVRTVEVHRAHVMEKMQARHLSDFIKQYLMLEL